MARPLAKPARILNREEQRRRAEARPLGRYERVAGEVVAMAPRRGARLRVKANAWLALRQAIAAAGLPCQALPDGVTIEVDLATDYEPDAVVNCGAAMAAEATSAPNPVVVVVAVSPSTRSVDTGAKLTDYFGVASIGHCLVVRADRRSVVHHRRREDGGIETTLLTAGQVALDPPGCTVSIDDSYLA